jgi:hypothetical protein
MGFTRSIGTHQSADLNNMNLDARAEKQGMQQLSPLP